MLDSSTSTDAPSGLLGNVCVTFKSASGTDSKGSGIFGRHSGKKSSFVVAGFGDRMQGVPGRERAVEEGGFVATAQHEDLLSQMLQSHLSGDFCLVGGRVGSMLWL